LVSITWSQLASSSCSAAPRRRHVGVIDQDGHGPEALLSAVEGAPNTAGIGDVHHHALRLSGLRPDLLDGPGERRLAPGGERDLGAGPGEEAREMLAEPARCVGHQRMAPLKVKKLVHGFFLMAWPASDQH